MKRDSSRRSWSFSREKKCGPPPAPAAACTSASRGSALENSLGAGEVLRQFRSGAESSAARARATPARHSDLTTLRAAQGTASDLDDQIARGGPSSPRSAAAAGLWGRPRTAAHPEALSRWGRSSCSGVERAPPQAPCRRRLKLNALPPPKGRGPGDSPSAGAAVKPNQLVWAVLAEIGCGGWAVCGCGRCAGVGGDDGAGVDAQRWGAAARTHSCA